MTRCGWFPALAIAILVAVPGARWAPAVVGQEFETAADFERARKELREAYASARTAAEKRAIVEKFRQLELKEIEADRRANPGTGNSNTKPPSKYSRQIYVPVMIAVATALAEKGKLDPRLLESTLRTVARGKITPKIRERLKKLQEAYGKGKNPLLDSMVGEDEAPAEDLVPTLINPQNRAVYLAGQEIQAETDPQNATVEASGPAKVVEERKVRFTGVGDVTLHARLGSKRSEPVEVTAAGLEVQEIAVQDTLEITDAKPPHFKKDGVAQGKPRVEPACLLQGKPLEIQVKFRATEPLSAAAKVTVVGVARDVEVKGEVEVPAGNGVATAILQSAKELTNKVAVNALEFTWYVEAGGERVKAGDPTPLRVYTTHKAPLQNISGRAGPVNDKLHYELACAWANGAAQNVGNGADSIGWNCDNRMRHHVHPKDYQPGKEPFVDAYPKGSTPPLNYDDLPGSWNIRSSGERGVSSLYYPPLEPKKPYENYSNYQNNFGWWVLDNPKHTGGRCNQQAALICDVLGTLGIKAKVHYLERRSTGKRTGRPVRQYFYAAGGSGPWNFHGLCKATLGDGSEWLYDGSFSSPPNRKNGQRAWAESEGGPFIQKFGPWYYDDWGGQVPENDIPDKSAWIGIGGRDQ